MSRLRWWLVGVVLGGELAVLLGPGRWMVRLAAVAVDAGLLALFLRARRCRHAHVRCVHGDESTFASQGRRACCSDCGAFLKAPLPAVCSVTGAAHSTRRSP